VQTYLQGLIFERPLNIDIFNFMVRVTL